MYRNPVTFMCLAILFFSHTATATTVFRCVSEQGRVSFSANGCLKEEAISHQEIKNPKPGGSGLNLSIMPQSLLQPSTSKNQLPAPQEPAIAGAKEATCLSTLSGSERRTAIIQKKVIAGMTREDVESALGKPDRITEHNSRARYHYVTQHKRHSRTVSFDDSGCVK
jgi:hypothetical protein